jgi:hypothetical protein
MTQRPVCEKFKSNINDIIDFDQDLPQWNYAIKHQNVEFIFWTLLSIISELDY